MNDHRVMVDEFSTARDVEPIEINPSPGSDESNLGIQPSEAAAETADPRMVVRVRCDFGRNEGYLRFRLPTRTNPHVTELSTLPYE